MTLSEQFALAEKHSPSYFLIEEDGYKMRCGDCGIKFWAKDMIKPFTPDGESHKPVCKECIDSEWLAAATDMTRLTGEKL